MPTRTSWTRVVALSLTAWSLACNPSASSGESRSAPAKSAGDVSNAGTIGETNDTADAGVRSYADASPDVHFDPNSSCAWGDPNKLGWTPAVCRALTQAEKSTDAVTEVVDASLDVSEVMADVSTRDAVMPDVRGEEASGPCPPDMVYVHGIYCGLRRFKCLKWIEDPAKNPFARCGAYEKPSKCSKLKPKVYKEFCIDKYEAAGPDGLPLADKSWNQARKLCKSAGKRLCRESEWTFACEGEEGRPYPYGYVRDNKICNFEITDGLIDKKGKLADHREPVKANPKCISPFGVQNMVGNIDEWVMLDRPYFSHRQKGKKMMSGLKGGWWGPLRNRCRPVTVDHDEVFHELQTGFRCCKDVAQGYRDAGAPKPVDDASTE